MNRIQATEFRHHMLHCMTRFSRIPAVLDVCEMFDEALQQKMWVITRINVPLAARGHHYGSKLLGQVCEWADMHEHTLRLEVSSSWDGFPEEQLYAWYRRYGFREYSAYSMQRNPGAEMYPNG